ncbi:NADPH-dependent FMN reductase [Bifidobacterium cuniculi]|uniref:Oxidoreductase n=1 Tax=Bifidobacterium cuniculi TaxID=1688 RepID=A0A087AYM0_9BIFI|nr:NADPH-dependent FMN reductase [Bifidobacterium cuniculi]KFI63870.1 oxidoreductase [Bifidobacterium cuniculi]
MAKPNIAFVETSLTDGSFEADLAKEAIKAIGDRAEVITVDYEDLPLLNEKSKLAAPDAALAIRDKFRNADAVWVFISQYQKSIPPMVHNLFDWLSTPMANDSQTTSVLDQKPVAITGVGGFNGMFARVQLGDLLEANNMRVFPVEVGLSVPDEALATDKWVLDEADVKAIDMQADDFLAFISENEEK